MVAQYLPCLRRSQRSVVSPGHSLEPPNLQFHASTHGWLFCLPFARTETDPGSQINSGPSPYEGEDDFFSRSQDDSALGKRTPSASYDAAGRPRGQSESVISQS